MPDLTPTRRQHRRCVAVCAALACAGVALGVARDAYACAAPPAEIKLVGAPADGDVDVPTDVIPYYENIASIQALGGDVLGRFTITAEDGTVMLARTRVADGAHFELVPDDPLQPNTKYVLHAEFEASFSLPSAASDDVHFTTGDGPLEESPEPPSARLIHYNLDRAGDCLPSFGTCISVGDDRAIVVVVFVDAADTIGIIGSRGSFFSSIDVPPMVGRCAQIRTRALNGTLSDPIMLCGSTVVSLEFHDTDRLECSSDGLKPLPPSPPFVPSSGNAPVPDAGTKPDAGKPGALDAGTQSADAQIADAAAPDAAAPPVRYIEGTRPGSGSGGCAAAPGTAPGPIALLVFALYALRRRATRG